MSAFPTDSAAPLASVVRRARAKQDPAVLEQRAVPRASIDELNTMDLDTLRERFHQTRRDDRGPVVRFLDLLDAPRNTILSTLAPGLRRRAEASGNTGAGGRGRVYFSDVLGEAGMSPGVARGVLGFIGDVAFDPLTYVGGTSIGAKVATTGGRVVTFGKQAGRALSKAEKVGAGVGAIGELADVAGGTKGLKQAVLGGAEHGGSLRERAGRSLSEVIRGKPTSEGGLVSQYADAVTMADDAGRKAVDAKIGAVDHFIRDYGYGAGPAAVKIGKDATGKVRLQVFAGRGDQTLRGSTQSLLHVPFTDISLLSVPAFGATGRAGAVAMERAGLTSARQGVSKAASSQHLRDIHDAADTAQKLVGDYSKLADEELKFRRANEATITRMEQAGSADAPREYGLLEQAGADPDAAVARRLAEFAQQREATTAQLAQARESITTRLKEVDKTPEKFNIGEILAMREGIRRFDAVAARHLERVGNNAEYLKLRKALLADEAARLDETQDVLKRLAVHDEAANRGYHATVLADDQVGKFHTKEEAAAIRKEGATRGERRENLRGKVAGLKKVMRTIGEPYTDEYVTAADSLLKARSDLRVISDKGVGAAGDGSSYTHRPFLGIDPATGNTVVNADLDTIGRVSERSHKLLDDYDDALDALVDAERNAGEPTIGQVAAGATKDELRDRLNTLREQLLAETVPLRSGGGATLDEVNESIRAADRGHLDQSRRNLLEMSDTEADAFEDVTRATHQGIAAALGASLATKSSALAFMTPEQMRLLRLHKDFLGTHDGIVAAATLAPLSEIADTIHHNDGAMATGIRNRLDQAQARVSESYRRYLGGGGGELSDQVRHAIYMMNDGGRRVANEKLAAMFRDIRQIASKHGRTNREPELLALATALDIKFNRGGETAYRTRGLDGEVTGFLKHLEDAARRGDIGKDFKGPLVEDLLEFTRKHDLLTPIRQIESREGILKPGQIRADYFPNQTTTTGREFMRRAETADLGGGYRPVQQAIGSGREAFLEPRGSDSAIFDSQRLGRKTEVFGGDRWVQTLSDEEIAAIPNADIRQRISDMKAAADEYDAMPNRPAMVASDPFRVNELKDRFRVLWGADEIPGGFMDTNYATALAGRLLQHEHAMAKEMFAREVLAAGALPVGVGDLKAFANQPPGSAVTLSNGMVGKLVQLRDGPAIRIGDDIFRPLNKDIRNLPDNPLLQALGDAGLGAIYHQSVAERIEGAAKLFTDDGYGFWKALDQLTAQWKRLTLFHPSWWMSNVIGESINYAAQDPAFAVALTKYGGFVAKMFLSRLDQETMGRLVAKVGGAEHNALDLAHSLDQTPIIGANFFADPTVRGMREQAILGTRAEKAGAALRASGWKADYEQALAHATAAGAGDIEAKAKAALRVAGDRGNRFVFEPWYRLNSMTSDMLRTVAYLSLKDQGWSHGEAIRRVVRAGFDYQDLTPFEKEWGRRLFPFWAWLKNNGIYQAKMLLDRPILTGSLPLLQHSIEEAIDGEGRLPITARPKWMQEQLAIQIGQEDRGRFGLLVGNFLPQEQALLAGRFAPGVGGVQDALKYAVSSLNPALRAPLEIGMGKEAFSDRTIGGDAAMSDMTIGQHIAGQVRPLREIPKLVQTAQEQGAGATAGRALLGGRVQPMSKDRLDISKGREFRDEEARLRTAVRRAEFKQDKAGSVLARARLLKLYEAMTQAGHGGDVPKWAIARLASLQPQTSL